MGIKELDKHLMEEFHRRVHDLSSLTPASIRVLADISSVLLCLWHPAMKQTEESKEGSYFS